MNVAVIGAGSWGTALAQVAATNGHSVALWARRAEVARAINDAHRNPDYLRDACYGEMLLSAYADMEKELPHGYALFHQPWMEEWYVANRQYKQAYELRR